MKYSTLYFDLDNTLLDFSAAERNAITQLLKLYELPSDSATAALYSSINRSYWERFERGEIKKQEIFAGRFESLLAALGQERDAVRMGDDYFKLLSEGHDMIEGAEEILKYLKLKGYTICITTNGVSFTQYKRIKESGLKKYFDYIFVSEDAGHQKPEKEYFDYVLQNSPEKDTSKILVIGDSQSSDILGGINSGLDTCWYNPSKQKGKYPTSYEIDDILKLKSFL